MKNSQNIKLQERQKQSQKISQIQITALKFLSMGNEALLEEIYRAVSENPALEIVEGEAPSDREQFTVRRGRNESTDAFQKIIENQEDYEESLQAHLLHQLNAMNLTKDEAFLCRRLIYNLDKNGFYGSMISPESFLPKKDPIAEHKLLERCLKLVQSLDPVGICCRNPEESLLVQARQSRFSDPLSLFILDGHLDFLSPPDTEKICSKLIGYKKSWHKKAFAPEIPLDSIEITKKNVEKSLNFILSLNPHPAQGYNSENSAENGNPDIVRKGVYNYKIERIVCDKSEKNFIFVIEKMMEDDSGINVRYMVEASQF